jgi:ATP-dependent DNA ligase
MRAIPGLHHHRLDRRAGSGRCFGSSLPCGGRRIGRAANRARRGAGIVRQPGWSPRSRSTAPTWNARLDERRAKLRNLLARPDGIRFSEGGDGEVIFRHACKLGLDGIVCKRRDSAYRSGRSKTWLKVKNPTSPAMLRFESSRQAVLAGYILAPCCSAPPAAAQRRPPGFIEPCIPTLASRPPTGPQWAHEIKHDGYRLIARRTGDRVRLFTRRGYDWSERYPLIAKAVAALRATSATIDGEAVCCDENGVSVFEELHSRRSDNRALLYAFDLLELDGEDLRPQPLHARKARLEQLREGAGRHTVQRTRRGRRLDRLRARLQARPRRHRLEAPRSPV